VKEAHPLVDNAYRLIRKKRYRDAVPVLEKAAGSRPSDPYPYFMLACAYLLSGELARVELLVKRARSLRQDYLPALQLEAFLLLKSSMEPGPVISRYLDITQRYPGDRTAMRALESLRAGSDFDALQKSARFARFVTIPRPEKRDAARAVRSAVRRRSRMRWWVPVAAVFAALLGGASFMYGPALVSIIGTLIIQSKTTPAPDWERMTPDRSWGDLIDKTKRSEVTYTNPEEVEKDFNASKLLMKEERYNAALRKINRLLNGNTSHPVRERADFLRSFILGVPDRAPERIPFNELSARPYLYNGCMVVLQGSVADINRGRGKTAFALVIPQTTASAAGVVDVYYQKDDPSITHGDPVNVVGVFMSATGGARVYMDARTVEAAR
jgi:hypothetical protein